MDGNVAVVEIVFIWLSSLLLLLLGSILGLESQRLILGSTSGINRAGVVTVVVVVVVVVVVAVTADVEEVIFSFLSPPLPI